MRGFLPSSLNDHTRAARGTGFDLEWDLENLLEQSPLIDGGGRAHTQAFAPMQQDDLIGEFRRQTQIVGDLNHRVTMLICQTAQAAKEVDLRPDIQMQRGFVQQ
jgi:hypothetical protein